MRQAGTRTDHLAGVAGLVFAGVLIVANLVLTRPESVIGRRVIRQTVGEMIAAC